MIVRFIPMRWGSGENYAYAISDSTTTFIVDPAEPKEVIPILEKMEVTPTKILTTHHHFDHAGGNKTLSEHFNIPVVGGKDVPYVTHIPKHGEIIKLNNINITALYTPCHTQDSICYYAHDTETNQKCIFTGDTLFTAGCGRFFEGTSQEMDVALNQIISSVPNDAYIYPGHEYTSSNIKFAETVMPNNPALQKLKRITHNMEYTTGCFTIRDEKLFNPFMRLEDSEVMENTGFSERAAVMKKLREMKNNS